MPYRMPDVLQDASRESVRQATLRPKMCCPGVQQVTAQLPTSMAAHDVHQVRVIQSDAGAAIAQP